MNLPAVHRSRISLREHSKLLAILVLIAVCEGNGAPALERVVNAADFGFDRRDATRALQSAIDSGADRVIVPVMKGGWNIDPVFLRSDNQELVFQPGVIVTARKGSFVGRRDCLFRADNRKNIALIGYGAILQMRKTDYQHKPYQRGEHRHCISLRGCQNVKIKGLVVRYSGGDGIYVGSLGNARWSESVLIKDVVLDENQRQGISVTSAKSLNVENCILRNTLGSKPMAGIDFEPNQPDQVLVNCRMLNCFFENNNRSGITIALSKLNATSVPVSIALQNCHAVGNLTAVSITGGKSGSVRGQLSFADCTFDRPRDHAVRLRETTLDLKLQFTRCHWQNTRYPLVLTPAKRSGDVASIELSECTICEALPRPVIWIPPSQDSRLRRRVAGDARLVHPWKGQHELGLAGSRLQVVRQPPVVSTVRIVQPQKSGTDLAKMQRPVTLTTSSLKNPLSSSEQIDKVEFSLWRGTEQVKMHMDETVPYQAEFDSTGLPQGIYILRASAFGAEAPNSIVANSTTAVTHGMADCTDRAPKARELPLKLDGHPPQERIMRLQLKIPKNAAKAIVVVTAFDADTSREGELEINGRGRIALFGNKGRSTNDGKIVQLRFPTKLGWWRNGTNTLIWKHLSSGGFRIEGVRVEFRDFFGN